MATLIRIGKVTVNLDNVTQISDMSDRVRLYYSAMSMDSSDFTEIYDDDAATLRAWLDWQARDIAAEVAKMREPEMGRIDE